MISRSRRTFLVQSALAASAFAGTRLMASPTLSSVDSDWIDAHVHVWTPDLQKYPLASGFKKSDMQPASFIPEELFAHSQPAGVKRIVLIQMSYYQYDNRYMLDVIKAYPGVFSGVGIVDYQAANVAEKMKELKQGGVRGFRIYPAAGEASKWVEDAGMAKMWLTAHKENLAICPLINPTDLPFIHKLCQKYPDTTVVIDHFARIGLSGQVDPQQLAELCALAKFPKVHVKTSAFYALGKKKAPYTDLLPMIRQVVDAYSPKRLMWASDCPFQVEGGHTYASSIELIRDRADFLSASDKEEMLRGTAERVFFQ
jgi:predicted TIM-barrel fold metal-dependent hydrolase